MSWLNLEKLLNGELEGPIEQLAVAAQYTEFGVERIYVVCKEDLLKCRNIFIEQAKELELLSRIDECGNVILGAIDDEGTPFKETLFMFLTPLAYEHYKSNTEDHPVFFINLK